MESINKPIVMCRTHIREFSANRIKDPFTGKWVNKREPDFQRILRHRNIVQEMCPSCERLMKKHEEI